MLLAATLGGLVGLVLALTGAGGAILAVPLLMFVLDWDVAQAAPVALLAVSASAFAGTLLGLHQGRVRYRAALLMAVAGSLMSPLGIALAQRIPAALLALMFSVLLGFIALRMGRAPRLAAPSAPDSAACKLDLDSGRLVWNAPCTRALAQAGMMAGFVSGLLGVGGGFLIVPALRRASDLSMDAIVATTLMVIALVSASGVLASAWSGQLPFEVGLPFAAGAVAAMLAGRVIASRLQGPRLQQGFAILAGGVALALAARTLVQLWA